MHCFDVLLRALGRKVVSRGCGLGFLKAEVLVKRISYGVPGEIFKQSKAVFLGAVLAGNQPRPIENTAGMKPQISRATPYFPQPPYRPTGVVSVWKFIVVQE